MKKIYLLPLVTFVVLQLGCNHINNGNIQDLVAKWYFIEGHSRTMFVSNTNQDIIDNSTPGDGEITVSGEINASLRFVEYVLTDSIQIYSIKTQSNFDSTYPFGEFSVLGFPADSFYIYHYYHNINSESTVDFFTFTTENYVHMDDVDSSITVDPFTIYGVGEWGLPDSSISISISGILSPNRLTVSANELTSFNYSSNSYDDINYFSLEFDENGLLTGLLEFNSGIPDTLEITYDLVDDTLTVYDQWLMGGDAFANMDSVVMSFTIINDNLILEFDYNPCEMIADTLCQSAFETLIGLQPNSLIDIQSSDSLVFSQIQPL